MHEDFVCSNGYLRPATASGQVVSGEDAVVDTHAAEDWQHGQLCQFLGNYFAEDIFNMDGSTRYHKLLPEKSRIRESCTDDKHARPNFCYFCCEHGRKRQATSLGKRSLVNLDAIRVVDCHQHAVSQPESPDNDQAI